MSGVPRIGRILDLFGLAVFLLGGGLAARAWMGFREVQDFQPSADGPPMAAVEMANGFWRLQRIGMGVMLAGIALFVMAWWVGRRGLTLPDEQGTS